MNQTSAFQKYVADNKIMIEYMKDHRQSWYDLATRRGLRIPHKDDIVLISGFVKTAAWILGYVSDRDAQMAEFKIKGFPGNDPEMLMTCDNKTGIVRSGPSSNSARQAYIPNRVNSVPDQCMFLSFYKAKSRFLRPSKIVANAGPHSPQAGEDEEAAGDQAQYSEEDEVDHIPALGSVSQI